MPTDIIAKKIKDLNKAYAMFSPLTNMPYVECEEENFYDRVRLYEDEEDAKKAAEELEDDGIRIQVRELKVQEIYVPVNAREPKGPKKKMYLNHVRQHIGILPFIGVNAVGYCPKGSELLTVELSGILPEGFEEKVGKNALYQPNLQLTGLYLMQEARRKKRMGGYEASAGAG